MTRGIYILKAENGRFEIGQSDDIETRLQSYKGYPLKVEHITSISLPSANEIEQTLHDLLRDKRKDGEWFELDQDDLVMLLSVAENSMLLWRVPPISRFEELKRKAKSIMEKSNEAANN